MNKKMQIILMSIILPVLSACFALIPGEINYMASDNIVMNQIAASAQDFDNSFFVYFVAIIPYFLRALYLLCDTINWYAVALLLSITWAFSILNYVFLYVHDKRKNKENGILYFSLSVLFAINVYFVLHLDFSIAAFFMMYAFIAFFHFVDQKGPFAYAQLFLLLLGACAWRHYVVKVLFFVSVFFLVREWKNKKQMMKKAIALTLSVLLLYAGVHSSKIYSVQYCDAQEYMDYRASFANIIDRKKYDYDTYREKVEQIGLTKNDIDMTWKWMIADAEAFEIQKIDELYYARPIWERYTLCVGSLLLSMLKTKWNWALGILLLSVFLSIKKNRASVVATAMFVFGMNLGYLIMQRVILRMTLPTYLGGVCFALLLLVENIDGTSLKISEKKIGKACLSAATVILIIGTCTLGVQFTDTIKQNNEKRENLIMTCREFIDENPQNIYIGGPTGVPVSPIRLWQPYEKTPIYAALGGWTFMHPYSKFRLKEIGLEEYDRQVFSSLLLPNVRYVAKDDVSSEYIRIFFQEHYDIEVSCVEENGFAEYKVYRYTVQE